MPIIRFFLLTILITIFGASTCLAADSGLLHYKLNTKIPSIKLKQVDNGKQIIFNPANGKPSVVMFFSISPSFRLKRAIVLANTLAELNKKFNDRVNVFGIYSGNNIRRLRDYIKDGLITIPILDDSKQNVYRRYGVFMLPIAIISDATGRLQSVIPFTANINDIIGNNLKLLLGDWTLEKFKKTLARPTNLAKTKEEKAYIRRVNYGRVMMARRMYPAALREFNTARKIMPKAIEALIGMGRVQLKLKKWGRAMETFNKALKIDKESDKALAGLGLAIYRSGDNKKALPILEKALISENQSVEVVISLADIYEKNGNIPKAVRLNKLAISLLQQRFQ